MLKLTTGLAALLMLVTIRVFAEPLPRDDSIWLKKMALAAHKTDYSGTFIYQSGNYVETSRITHIFDGENEHERLEGLDGERSEIIRKNGQVWCYLGDRMVLAAKQEGARTFPALLPEQLSLLAENYVTRTGEEIRVAGLQAHSIIFQPKDKMRYAHKMWAQSNTGLLLKAVVLDEHNRVIEQYAFTQLKIGGEIDRKWLLEIKAAEKLAAEKTENNVNVRSTPNESGWLVYALPAGFKKIAEVTRRMRENQSPVIHLVYSDGLAGISVFIEKLRDKSDVKAGLYSKGVIQVYSKILDENLLTVVGEVPARTVMQVADSVRYGGHQ
jgi:sigma-E factor negative regulatory protein RseB